jgi:hypothetical protein
MKKKLIDTIIRWSDEHEALFFAVVFTILLGTITAFVVLTTPR